MSTPSSSALPLPRTPQLALDGHRGWQALLPREADRHERGGRKARGGSGGPGGARDRDRLQPPGRTPSISRLARSSLRGADRAGRAVAMAFCEPSTPGRHADLDAAQKRSGPAERCSMSSLAPHRLAAVVSGRRARRGRGLALHELSEHDTARLWLSTRGGVEGQGFFSFRAGYAQPPWSPSATGGHCGSIASSRPSS